ncbi:MAG: PAS domain S-box protein [Gallionella sp.]|nr:PAS domain S-box protein [Gallionella sp.]
MTRPHLSKLLPLLVLASGFVATYFLQQAAFNASHQTQQDYFENQSREIVLHIEQRLAAYEQILRGVKGMFVASKSVGRDEFRNYIIHQRLEDHYPGIQGVGFSLVVPPQEKSRHIGAIRKEGFSYYTVWPEGDRSLYTSIVYLEPFTGRNLRAFGYDMYSETTRRVAMERARDSNEPALSGKVRLVQETEQDVQAGFLMYIPVYRHGRPHETLADRRANIIGWVYAPFRMNDLMYGILGNQSNNTDLEIFDGEDETPKTLMYDSRSAQKQSGTPLYDFSQCLQIAGHNWHIRLHSLPTLEANIDTARATTIQLTGILVSVLLSLLVWQLVRGRARALDLAQDMTRELRESQEHIHLLLDSAAEGIYGVDIHGNCTFVNAAFLRILGYQDANEIVGKHIHELIHHSHANGILYPEGDCRIYQSYRCNEKMHVSDEVFWHRDGSSFAVEYWSSPIIRDGQVIGAIATFFDITERKRTEEKLRTLSTAIEQSPLSVVITDLDAKIQYANPCFLNTTGYSMEETIGQNPRILQSGQTPKKTYVEMWKALTHGQVWRGELVNKRKNGEFYWEEAHIAPVMGAAGNTMHYVAVKLEITQRKRAEEALLESEAKFRTIIEATPVPLALNDEQGNIVYLNRAFVQTLGYTTDDIPTREDWWPLAYPDPQYRQFVAENWQANLKEAKRTGSPFHAMELNIRCKDDVMRTFIASAASIKEHFAGTHMVILYDISERKHAEKELWDKNQLLDSIIENIPNMIFLKRASDLRFALFNRAGEELLGHDRDELLGRNDYDFFPKEQADFFIGKDRTTLEQHGVVDIPEESIKTPHGIRILHTRKLTLRNVLGEPQYLLGISEDITERKTMQTQIANQLAFTESVINAEVDALAVCHGIAESPYVRFTIWNPSMEALTGYGMEEINRLGWYQTLYTDAEVQEQAQQRMERMRQGEHLYGEEWTITRKNGAHRVVQIHTVTVAEDNVGVHILAVLRDITERKEHEEELLRSNADLEQFSYAVSHDMRQPLRMVSSYLQLLERSLAGQLDNEKRDYFNFAIEGAKRIDQMLVALLEYSRIGRKGEPPTWIDSRALLDEALQFLQPTLDEAQARLSITGEWPRILSSHDEILRLLQNLIGNATKYRIAGQTPEITVNSKAVKHEWHLSIADNGIGIIPGQIKRLFQVFQRLQSRESYEGTGIGLALCRKIAEHHKGRIWAESAGENQGSKFCVVLPVLREEAISAKGKVA